MSNPTVVITGAAAGIGRATALAFAAEGYDVGAYDLDQAGLDSLGAEVEQRGRGCVTGVLDVRDPEAFAEALADFSGRYGRLDVLVNNAAAIVGGPVPELDWEDWDRIRAVNVEGYIAMCKVAVHELEKTQGNIVVVGSVSGIAGDWGQAPYNSTKALVMNMVKSMALDHGPAGVRVNAVVPAMTRTPLTADMVDDPKVHAAAVNRVALRRIAEPEDIAPAVLWLASTDAAYVTGAFLNVDGGTMASTGQAHVE